MCPQAGCFPWSRPMPHTHQNVGQGGKLSEYSDVFNLADIIADVLTDHNKAAHDALAINSDQVDGEEAAAIVTEARVGAVLTKAIVDALAVNAGQVDGVEGAEIVQRDGSVGLTAAWTNVWSIISPYFKATTGGNIALGNHPACLKLSYVADEIARIVGVSNALAGLNVSKIILGVFELNALVANNKIDDSLKWDGKVFGDLDGKIRLTAPTELTINAAAVTVTKSYHRIDGEGDAADTLSTINGGTDGMILVIQSENAARNITVDEAGNIFLTGPNCVLADPACKLILIYDLTNTVWTELGRCTG